MKKNRKRKTGIIKKISICLTMLTICSILSIACQAASNFQLPSFLDKYNVYSGGSTYIPNLSDYPFTEKGNNVTSIGFDALYGDDKPFIEYMGEIPYALKDKQNFTQYRVYNGDTLSGTKRPWSNSTLDGITELDSDTKEPHIWAMTTSHDLFNVAGIGLSIVGGINWLASLLVNLMITFKSLNIADITSLIDKNGSFSNLLAKVFLFDPKTFSFSPLLIFAVASFVVCLVALTFKVIKGRASLRQVIEEIGYLCIAGAISALFITGTNASKISGISMDIITALTNNLGTNVSDSAEVFYYNTGNTNLDNSQTQRSLLKKIYIDQLINAQFGYPVNELYITNSNGGKGGFGDVETVQQAIQKTLGIDDIDVYGLAVTTNTDGTRRVNNLGYYLWASNSGVKSNGYSAPFYTDDNGDIQIYNKTSDRVLYVVDFLANLRALSKDDAVISKIDNIMVSLTAPQYGTAILNVFAVLLQNIALAYALLLISIFCILGQLIVTLGSYCMVIIPTLLLFNKTRPMAKKMLFTFVLGFIRFLIGSALFNVVILTAVLLSEGGFMGILVSILVCFFMGKFGPILLKEINNAITNYGRGKEFNFASKLYNRANGVMDKYTSKERNKKKNNSLVIGEDGNVHRRGEENCTDKIKKGLNNRRGLPGTRQRDASNTQMEEQYDATRNVADNEVIFDKSEVKDDNDNENNNKNKNITENINIIDIDGGFNRNAGNNSTRKNEQNGVYMGGFNDYNNNNNGNNNNSDDNIIISSTSSDGDFGTQDTSYMLENNSYPNNNDDNNSYSDNNDSDNADYSSEDSSIVVYNDNDNYIDNYDDGDHYDNDCDGNDNYTYYESDSNPEIENNHGIDADRLDYSSDNNITDNSNDNDNTNYDCGDIIDVENFVSTSREEKIKAMKKERRNRKLVNGALILSSHVPLVGSKLNNTIANKITQNNRNKEELLNEMSSTILNGDIEDYTLNGIFNATKQRMLKNTAATSRSSREKNLDKARSMITVEDVERLKKFAQTKNKNKNNSENSNNQATENITRNINILKIRDTRNNSNNQNQSKNNANNSYYNNGNGDGGDINQRILLSNKDNLIVSNENIDLDNKN